MVKLPNCQMVKWSNGQMVKWSNVLLTNIWLFDHLDILKTPPLLLPSGKGFKIHHI
jgi:hypothetical protein